MPGGWTTVQPPRSVSHASSIRHSRRGGNHIISKPTSVITVVDRADGICTRRPAADSGRVLVGRTDRGIIDPSEDSTITLG
jgi:hypothetical protein